MIEKHLLADGFARRYDTEATRDGLPPGEGVFLACSFWLVDSLLATGRRVEAQQLFERLLSLRNDVGLLSEEYDTRCETPGWQFPTGTFAYCACKYGPNLTRSEKPIRQRSGHEITSN